MATRRIRDNAQNWDKIGAATMGDDPHGGEQGRKAREKEMSIILTPNQEKAIQDGIDGGLIGSVDEFITSAINSLPQRAGGFDKATAREAVVRIGKSGKASVSTCKACPFVSSRISDTASDAAIGA